MAEKLKNPEKADLNKDGKLSSYEKKRGAAIEKAMDKSEGMSRAQQAAIAIAKMKKEELAELVREVLAETEVEEAVTQMHVTPTNKPDIKAALKKKGVTDTSSVDKAKPGEVIAVEELTSVGHVDDEPGMLKQFAYDTADYAAKLYKLLHHYEQMEDHVDFPNWWQHKVMMAREYISKATHYLEFETMKPHLDAKIDAHSEEELDEDYVPRTKEDLVFQYLRDAWQFGAMKGKDVNPDEELSTMADSLLANLPDYDAAELSELFRRAKNKMVNYQGHDYEILDIDSAGTFTLIDPKHKFFVNKNQMKQGRVPDVKEPEVEDVPLMNLKEDGEINDKNFSPKDDEEKGFVAQDAALKAKAARKKALKPILDKLEKSGVISRVDGKLKINDMDAYKKALAAINEVLAENKATCCGKCGRTHVKGTECKKPFLTGKDHCRVR